MKWQESFKQLQGLLEESGINVAEVEHALRRQHIETPSWGYGNAGTRFKVFNDPTAAKTVHQRIDDAAAVHRLSGITPSIALHIPWDQTEDWAALKNYASERGITIGAINPNLFQDEEYRLGSVCHPNSSVREKAIEHLIECCDIMSATGSSILSVWLADGTNYAGQDNMRDRKERMLEALARVIHRLPVQSRMLLEYKFFEPAFFHTDIADWGTSFALCQLLGPQAEVLVDTGHHPQGTNIAYIVAQLLSEGRLGGFHFNARNYADDDLIVGSSNPWELFVIFVELVQAGELAENVAYMIDQSHSIEPKIEAMLLSVLNCQKALAKALIVNYQMLRERQLAGDVLGAHQILTNAFDTDVRPMLAHVRTQMGVPADPMAELSSSGLLAKLAQQRG